MFSTAGYRKNLKGTLLPALLFPTCSPIIILAGQLMTEDKENHVESDSGTENDDGSVYTGTGTDDGNDDDDQLSDEPSAVEEPAPNAEKVLDDKQVVSELTSRMEAIMSARRRSESDSSLPSEIFRHLVDNHKDHFGVATAPNLRFLQVAMTNLGCNREYRAKGEPEGDRWYSEMSAGYHVSGKIIEEQTLAMDCVFVDFTEKMSKNQTTAKNYGKTWINMYIPLDTVKQFMTYIKTGTGWEVDSKTVTVDERQGLMSVSLNISSEDPPNYFAAKITDGKLKRFKSGTVQEIFNDPKSRFIHLSNVYFRLSMSVLTPVNSSNPPRPTESKCKLKYHLVGIEGLSAAFDVEPVKVNTYKGKKMTIK
jgi:hypothetical protein